MSFMSKIKSVPAYIKNNKATVANGVASIASTGYVSFRVATDKDFPVTLVGSWMAGFMGVTVGSAVTNACAGTAVNEVNAGLAGATAAVIAHEAFVHGRSFLNKTREAAATSMEMVGDAIANSGEMIA